MRGVVLAGGTGSRLSPITEVTNKHLLPVYDRPMIFHPLATLLNAGIKDIMIVSGPDHAGAFLRLLKDGAQFGARFTFRVQQGSGGIAEALSLAEDFAQGDNLAVILGDNIFADDFQAEIQSFWEGTGAKLFVKKTDQAHRFGVAEVDENGTVLNIEEKPRHPKSDLAITGLYLYDNQVFDVIRTLRPSWRNELEITDVNNYYVGKKQAKIVHVNGDWTDAGTFESLYRANQIARKKVLAGLTDYNRERMLQGIKLSAEEHNSFPHLVAVNDGN